MKSELIKEFDSLIFSEKYEMALDLCNEVIKSNPDDSQAYFLRGRAKRGLLPIQEGIIDIRIAIDMGNSKALDYLNNYEKRAEAYRTLAKKDNEKETLFDLIKRTFPKAAQKLDDWLDMPKAWNSLKVLFDFNKNADFKKWGHLTYYSQIRILEDFLLSVDIYFTEYSNRTGYWLSDESKKIFDITGGFQFNEKKEAIFFGIELYEIPSNFISISEENNAHEVNSFEKKASPKVKSGSQSDSLVILCLILVSINFLIVSGVVARIKACFSKKLKITIQI